jgi:transposase
MTKDLLNLVDWLNSFEVSSVAMESTGVYWKPVFNLLEGQFEVVLVNAQHLKAVPGRKTDCKDAEWIADLLQHGLLKASFIPPAPQRHLRDLTRYRSSLVGERARLVNRLHKVLEDANLKLGAVATDITGVSARAMLNRLLEGETNPAVLAELARGRLKEKRELLEQALTGVLAPHHRCLLISQLAHLDFLDEQIAYFDTEIEERLQGPVLETDLDTNQNDKVNTSLTEPKELGLEQTETNQEQTQPFTYEQAIALLDTIPGISRRLAEIIAAEVGLDMSRFPSAQHLASWAGICPGNHQSAGKHLSGKTRKGSQWLRQALTEAAHGAMRTKNCYLSAQGRRLTLRRGKKKAVIAVGHSILVMVYHILKRKEPYKELGGSYFDERDRQAVQRRLVGRLENLGFQVTLQEVAKVPA